jgi:hypothetical protein
LEEAAWERLSRLLVSPDELIAGLDDMIERERNVRGDSEQEAQAWLARIAGLDGQRQRAQDGYLAGAFSVAELKAKLAGIEEQRTIAERELALCRSRHSRVAELEEIRDGYANGLLGMYAWGREADLEAATPEQRREEYRKHRVRVEITPEGEAVMMGTFGKQTLCTNETPS